MQLSKKQFRALFAQRRPARQETTKSGPPWATIVSVIGFLTSLAAFGFSVVAFFNSIEEVDDIRIVSNAWPVVRYRNDGGAGVHAAGQWIITNAGNRSAAISFPAVIIMVDTPLSTGRPCYDGPTLANVGYDLAPFVIEPKQVLIKQLKLQDAAPDEMKQVPLRPPFDENKPLNVKVCNLLFLVTPDEEIRATQPLYAGTWGGGFETAVIPRVPPLEIRSVPWALVHRTRSNFLKGAQGEASKASK
jgi:hypothetical protein